jgi:hypothetical protein
VKKKIQNTIDKRKEKIASRLEKNEMESVKPVFATSDVEFDISEKVSAIHCGGIGIVRQMVNYLGLAKRINEQIQLLKRHLPYHESDHILNIAYNIICGGRNLENLELLRNNENYLDALGAPRIPDPTTAGDFLRRFTEEDVFALMDCGNEINVKAWKQGLSKKARRIGIIDIDGKIQETYGACKEGIDFTYKKSWGFSTLVLTEATSGAHLFVANRPGNILSQENAAYWLDQAITVVKKGFERVIMRGDTAYSLTDEFDDWDDNGVDFIFGYDARENLVKMAELLPKNVWHEVERRERPVLSSPRRKKVRTKQAVVRKRKFRCLTLKQEWVSEFEYRPGKCEKHYRVLVLKKRIEESCGQQVLFDSYRYFFYITNIDDMTTHDLLVFIRKRCNHENKVEQLDNGIHALKMPAAEFTANWAYMAIVMLAWNIKSWMGLLLPDQDRKQKIIACEFKSFQNWIINIPCQVLRTGRKVVFRFLNYNPWVEMIFVLSDLLRPVRCAPA